ncbi:MAG: serpin family protein [Desulfomonilaceae bacterium]
MKRSPIIFTALFALLSLTLFCPGPALCSAAESEGDAAAKAVNAFAIDLYGQLRDGSGNIFFSPYSISASLAMAYAGARGETESQMAKALHFSLEKSKINGAFRALNEQVLAAGGRKGLELNIANALWAEKSFSFKKEFLETVRINFLPDHGWFPRIPFVTEAVASIWPGDPGCLRQVDFRHAPESARKTINSWVEKQTRNKIKDLMSPDSISSGTRLVITNAIYFKGFWESQFKKKWTKQDKFTLLDGTEIKVPMMEQTKPFGYAEKLELQIVEMPYKGEGLSMVVLLPSKQKNFDEFERSLTSDKLHRWTRMLPMRLVEVHFPKFKMDSAYRLRRTLMKLAMTDPFSVNDADFSGMTGKKNLFIEEALHKAFVDVKEEGTEAAAATAVTATLKGMPRPKPIPVFRADHPFVFLIWHKPSRCILFMGRVVKP